MIATTHPLLGSPYQSYAYAYPHKTAYRPFPSPLPLRDLWADEDRSALSLYVHVPFCGMRCGFCNLFTRAGADSSTVERYLAALRTQSEMVADSVGPSQYARFAIGGGTPTYLDLAGLEKVLDLAETTMGARLREIPSSVEVSPDTVDGEKLALLVGRGIDRISIGVETFDEDEARAVIRPQKRVQVERALTLIRESRATTLNIDLIYGLPGQTPETWRMSLDAALAHRPEEIYLYPLYVRPLTGLDRTGREWDDDRMRLYREGRDLLLGSGYGQTSMRMFRRLDAPEATGPKYCCQDDGMIGLGCGARSYTRTTHYASEYAVAARGVRAIIDDYAGRPASAFRSADFGFVLDGDDRRRRFVIQSILTCEGLSLAEYRARFGSDALDDLPCLEDLDALGLADYEGDRLVLNPHGLERSDAIGPWLDSDMVVRLKRDYQWH